MFFFKLVIEKIQNLKIMTMAAVLEKYPETWMRDYICQGKLSTSFL